MRKVTLDIAPVRKGRAVAPDLGRYRGFLRAVAHRSLGRDLQARMDSSDLVQEAIAKAWEDRDMYCGSSDGEFRTWILKILRRVILQAARKQRAKKRDPRKEKQLQQRFDESSGYIEQLLEAKTLTPDESVAYSEVKLKSLDALMELPEELRDILIMRIVEKSTLATIGNQLGVDLGTASRRYARAVVAFRAVLKKRGLDQLE